MEQGTLKHPCVAAMPVPNIGAGHLSLCMMWPRSVNYYDVRACFHYYHLPRRRPLQGTKQSCVRLPLVMSPLLLGTL